MGRRAPYPAETRRRALELYLEHGSAETARILKAEGIEVPANTVAQWGTRAGVTVTRSQNVEASIQAAVRSAAERRARMADRLLDIAEQALERELALIGKADLRDVVGARTRAIHDHQLLSGAATTRTETLSPEQVHGLINELAARREKVA